MKAHTLLTVGLTAVLLVAGQNRVPAAETEIKLPRTPDVIFVPTPEPVVKAMLDLAKVKPGEVVYDLGCGDGRAVIAAARDFGARGIGVDIDPDRIRESRANAEKAGVSDKVEFKEADLFEMNFSDADVLFLYLLPSLNLKLRPKILDELRPGTRVVSHSFSMSDWKADQTASPSGRTVHFWIVPAKVAGTWTLQLPDGKKASLNLEQEFQYVQGTLSIDGRSVPIKDGRLNGATLTFKYGSGADEGTGTFTVAGNQLTGSVRQGSGRTQVSWSGTR